MYSHGEALAQRTWHLLSYTILVSEARSVRRHRAVESEMDLPLERDCPLRARKLRAMIKRSSLTLKDWLVP